MSKPLRALVAPLLSLALLVPAWAAPATAVDTSTPVAATAGRLPAVDRSTDPLADLDEYEIRLAHLINRKRIQRGLPALKRVDACLDGMSERWSKKLAANSELVHRDLGVVLRTCHLSWTGEVLASSGGATPKAVVRAWMKSDAHRVVIMRPRARIIGMGVARNGAGDLYAAVNLGRR